MEAKSEPQLLHIKRDIRSEDLYLLILEVSQSHLNLALDTPAYVENAEPVNLRQIVQ